MAVKRGTLHYFAYGSNLHPARLGERVPSARLLDAVQLNSHRLRFHKKSHDGSSKCNLLNTGNEPDVVYGALYELDAEHKDLLDRFEGCGNGYQDCLINITQRGKEYPCFTYMAEDSHIEENLQPYHWYKNLVILGASYLKFPENYMAQIEAVDSMLDSNIERRQDMQALIEKINNHG